ncbi:MAG: UPF0149 family protein [Xanthomonadaceae bacterium]|nr:UPF0149 family protein [Xanthomonadaceae bacterium]
MKNLSDPLSDDEIEWLEHFLLDRIDDDADTEGKDEGVLDISELDGLFTAVVSGPVMVPPSVWLPALWGDYPPEWGSEKDVEHVLALLMRHMNGIAATLMAHPEDFEPLFLERTVEGKVYTIVDEWCEGYMRGVNLAPEPWSEGGLEMTVLLAPIRAFTSGSGWQAHTLSSDQEVANVQDAITPNVREIHAWWLARRESHASVQTTLRRATPRVGRNDPCPCGSGRKYKKCCLH